MAARRRCAPSAGRLARRPCRAARRGSRSARPEADITPSSLAGIYLGGYGIGPVHPAQGVLRHIYVRVIAIRDRAGHQIVIGAIDAQGYSVAYQQGPYGISDIQAEVQRTLGIPAQDIILQATHSHNGPDDIGVWGGVPDGYLAFVTAQAEAAIHRAVAAERPAALRWATADMTGFSRTFGSDTDATHTGDNRDYPPDNQLRALQAVTPSGRVIATLVNYSTHPTIYGPLNRVSPDWPGATATFLEHDELGIAPRVRYGYPGLGRGGDGRRARPHVAGRDPARDRPAGRPRPAQRQRPRGHLRQRRGADGEPGAGHPRPPTCAGRVVGGAAR